MGRSQSGGKAEGSGGGGKRGYAANGPDRVGNSTKGKAAAKNGGSFTEGKAASKHRGKGTDATNIANSNPGSTWNIRGRRNHDASDHERVVNGNSQGSRSTGEVTLKDLLAQVAPQARISSELEPQEFDYTSNESVARAYAAYEGRYGSSTNRRDGYAILSGGSTSAGATVASSLSNAAAPNPKGRNKISLQHAIGTGPSSCDSNFPDDAREKESGEPDNEEEFLERWSGLFSQGSPLLDGTARDPFNEELRRRSEVTWKKSGERAGHRARYQKRRQLREAEAQETAMFEHAPETDGSAGAQRWSAVDRSSATKYG